VGARGGTGGRGDGDADGAEQQADEGDQRVAA
jgi:hypothetical protein